MLFSARYECFEQQKKEDALRRQPISIGNNGWSLCEPEEGKRKYSPLDAQKREELSHRQLRNALRGLFNFYCKLLSNKFPY